MKYILFLILSLSNVYADDLSEILYYRGRTLGSTPQQQILKAKEILNQVGEVTASLGIQTQLKTFKDNKGNSYPAIVISPFGSHPANQEAARIGRLMGQLPLVFSPYDLGRSGSLAFFDPTGTMLGVSYEFILGDALCSSYLHELYHAQTYYHVMTNKNSLWAGVMKVLNGSYLSSTNSDYYYRFSSLDEIGATAYSVKLDTIKILEMRKTLTPAEFNRSRGEAESLLGQIYQSARAGYYLARQVQDVAQRTLKAKASVSSTEITLGQSKKAVTTLTYLLDSYTREVGGRMVTHHNGAELKLYGSSEASVANRLNSIITKAKNAEAAFKNVEACIYVLIEFPDVSKTNFPCLESKASFPFSQLE